MFILFKIVFHFICSIGRFFRKLLQFVVGRRHEELGLSSPKTEPVTLEHIRIIGEMENDSNRPYQSSVSTPTIPRAQWNSWGADDIFRQKQSTSSSSPTDKPEENIDYFTDIAATVKKTPKIILKKRLNDNDTQISANSQHHSRLQMTNDELVDFQPGLNEWHEEGANDPSAGTWDNEDDFVGLSLDASEALRETRRIDRERKLREHQQRKLDKEASRTFSHKRENLT